MPKAKIVKPKKARKHRHEVIWAGAAYEDFGVKGALMKNHGLKSKRYHTVVQRLRRKLGH